MIIHNVNCSQTDMANIITIGNYEPIVVTPTRIDLHSTKYGVANLSFSDISGPKELQILIKRQDINVAEYINFSCEYLQRTQLENLIEDYYETHSTKIREKLFSGQEQDPLYSHIIPIFNKIQTRITH